MKLPIYQIDAFADKSFTGNPAAVVPLTEWLSDSVMQSIAEENNLAETAFFVPNAEGFHIRWFTPTAEVKLCGHATLASAYVIFNILDYQKDTILFDSLSGILAVKKDSDFITLNFPSQPPQAINKPPDLYKGLGIDPIECLAHEDILAVFEKEDDVINLKPNFESLIKLDLRGVIVTAPSKNYDFIVRFFAPKYGIPEDPVTGSAYTQLMPYWCNKLGKTKLNAKQVSARGGILFCELTGNRVLISGRAVIYMTGEIELSV